MKLEPPMVDVHFKRLNTFQRATASFRYVALSIEHWISPDGSLRHWMKANTRVAVFMAVPTFMVFPVITMALWELESWINALTSITGKLIVLPVLVLLALIIVCRITSVFIKR